MSKKKKKGFGLDALKEPPDDALVVTSVDRDNGVITVSGVDEAPGPDVTAVTETTIDPEPPFRVVYKPHAESPYRDKSTGAPRRGRHEIVPSSIKIPPPPKPKMGDKPRMTIVVVAQSEDDRNYQYSIVDGIDPAGLKALGGEILYESEIHERGSWGHGWRKTVRIFGKIRNKRIGIPGSLRR